MDDLTPSIIAFRLASAEDLTALRARLPAVASSRFDWHLHESHYEGDYLLGEISGDPHLWKVRIFKDGGEFEIEVWFRRADERELQPDELQARAELVAELKVLLEVKTSPQFLLSASH